MIDAVNGEEALEKFRAESPDLVLLALNMPGIGGPGDVPGPAHLAPMSRIIILSVRNNERDKVEALDAGADDYVTKPFGIQELLARIRAAMRRAPGGEQGPRTIRTEDLEIDFDARTARANGKAVRLTPKEFDLLRHLVMNGNKAVPHRKLLQAVWGPDYGDEVEYLRVFMNALRKKVEPNPSKPKYLLTEPWVGYRFAVPEHDAKAPAGS